MTLIESSGLKTRVLSGVKWSSISQIGRQLLQMCSIAILTHFLSPSDFGLVGMATIVTGFVSIFKDLGTSAAVIQHKEISDDFLSSLFWINVGFGLLSGAILFGISHLVGAFYNEPRVVSILRGLSLTFFISGLSIIYQAILERDLQFNRLAKIELVAALLGSITGISSAVLGCGAQSIVYQTIAATTVSTVLLWFAKGWRPKITFHWKEIKAVSNYSLSLTSFSIFNYFARNADYLLIGKFLGAQDLGYYTLAYRLMLYPLQAISSVIGRVMFPFFSKIQDDNNKFRSAYLKTAGIVATVTFPVMLGLIALCKPFVFTVFGSKWGPSILLIKILAPLGMVQSIITLNGHIYRAKGFANLQFKVGVVLTVFIILSFAVGLNWGVAGVASCYAIVTFLLIYPALSIPYKLIGLRLRDLWSVLLWPLISSMVMFSVILVLRSVMPAIDYLSILLTLIPTGLIAYLAAWWVFDRNHIKQVLEIIGIRA